MSETCRGQAHAMCDPLAMALGPMSKRPVPRGLHGPVPDSATAAPLALVPGQWVPWVAHGMALAHVTGEGNQAAIN